MHVSLGNVAPIEARGPSAAVNGGKASGGEKDKPLSGQRITTVQMPDGLKVSETLRTIADLWRRHSTEAPAWVECDNAVVEGVLAEEFGCAAGRPKGWKETTS